MSIESEITRINNNIAATYTALSAKGATMPETENSANLASTVATVPSGGGGDPSRLIFEVNDGVASRPVVALNDNSFAGITSVGTMALFNAYYSNTNITGGVSFPQLTTVNDSGLESAFNGCTGLTSVSFPSLTSIGTSGLNNAFSGCTGLTSIYFPELTTVGNYGLTYAFYGCTGLTSVSFTNLTSIGSNGLEAAFSSCTGLTGSISFPKLSTIDTYGLNNAFYECTNITEIHFPASIQATIEGLSGYDTKFGASNATIYFDL